MYIVWGSVLDFFITFINQDALNWSKVTGKAFIMLQKNSISNKFCSFEFSIHQRILKNKMYHSYWAVFNIDNNQIMISEDHVTLNTAMMLIIKLYITGIHYILQYIHIAILNHNNISQFVLYFDQINAALVSRLVFFQKHEKISLASHFWLVSKLPQYYF